VVYGDDYAKFKTRDGCARLAAGTYGPNAYWLWGETMLYCMDDVRILRDVWTLFRRGMLESFDTDPTAYTTLSQAMPCRQTFPTETNHLRHLCGIIRPDKRESISTPQHCRGQCHVARLLAEPKEKSISVSELTRPQKCCLLAACV